MRIHRLLGYVVASTLIFSSASAYSEVFIKEFSDLIKEHGQAEWNHKSGPKLDFQTDRLGSVEQGVKEITEGEYSGDEIEYLRINAKPVAGQSEFGLHGNYTYDLPE